jgi:hypothetical protein
MEVDTRTDAEKAADAARLAPGGAQASNADREAEERRGDGRHVNNPRAPEAVARQHEEVDQANAKRNEQNREGHAKNMERVEAEAGEAQMRTAHADDHRANHVPTGKQTNRNTPRIDADGTKHWDQ